MEILRKIALSASLVVVMLSARAQTDNDLQNAFSASYSAEAKSNYALAISSIMPFYNDKNYELNLRLGWLSYMSKNYPSSSAYYLKSCLLKPNSIEAKFGYTKPLSALQSWDKVLEQYLAILKIDNQNTQANYWAGTIEYNRKKYDLASKYFEKIISLYPFDYDANHMLAWSYLSLNKKSEAKVFFNKALLIKPADSSSTDGLNRSK
jgi:tetratricopeptide (TPR) repeat protein